MAKSNFIRQTASGSIYIKDRKDKEYLINPGDLSSKSTSNKRRGESSVSNKFKLVTVRKLTNHTLQDVTDSLNNQQAILRDTALRTKQPIPFETTIPTTIDDLNQIYGVYVDEDLNSTNNLVYIFSSPVAKFKCFITANGTGIKDYSVHIIHIVDKTINVDNTSSSKWRLYTIDSNLNGTNTNTYILESNALPVCFGHNFDINSVHYVGGGCWSGMSVELTDRTPIFDLAPVDGRYIVIGTPVNSGLGLRANSIVEYSFVPTYSFTWCRGVLNLNRRNRKCTSNYTSPDGVVQLDKTFDYSLKHTYRPDIKLLHPSGSSNYEVKSIDLTEYSYGNATYVGCTNYRINSVYQSPDFGTDAARTSLQSYSQTTNVIRPSELEIQLQNSTNKISFENLSHIPILATSNDMSNILKLSFGEALGSINHPYELKVTSGSRSYGYSYSYKLWWTYGKIFNFYPTGDTKRYLTNNTGSPGGAGSMFDFGQLINAPGIPNAVMTTWDSPVNPPSGYFPYYVGKLEFIIQYNNPPIFGHQNIYYYEINPPQIDAGEAENNYVDNSSEIDNQKVMQSLYSEILAGMGGEGLSEFNIGNITRAANETDTLAMREPTGMQRAEFRNNPEYYPNKFWTGVDFKLENI